MHAYDNLPIDAYKRLNTIFTFDVSLVAFVLQLSLVKSDSISNVITVASNRQISAHTMNYDNNNNNNSIVHEE
jgi:hypothetical protein